MSSDAPAIWHLVTIESLPPLDGMESVVFVLRNAGKVYGVTVTGEGPLTTKGTVEALRASIAHTLKRLGLPVDVIGARVPEPGELDTPPDTKLN